MKPFVWLMAVALCCSVSVFGSEEREAAVAAAAFKQHIATLKGQDMKQGGDYVSWVEPKFDVWRTQSLIRPFAASLDVVRGVVTPVKNSSGAEEIGAPKMVRYVARFAYSDAKWSLAELMVSRRIGADEPEPVSKKDPEWGILETAMGLK